MSFVSGHGEDIDGYITFDLNVPVTEEDKILGALSKMTYVKSVSAQETPAEWEARGLRPYEVSFRIPSMVPFATLGTKADGRKKITDAYKAVFSGSEVSIAEAYKDPWARAQLYLALQFDEALTTGSFSEANKAVDRAFNIKI